MFFRGAAARKRWKAPKKTRVRRRVRPLTVEVLIRKHKELLEALSEAQLKRLHEQFERYDPDHSGYMLAQNLRKVLEGLGDKPSDAEMDELIELVNADALSLIDFEEFLTLIAIRSQHRNAPVTVLEAFKVYDEKDTGFIKIDVLKEALLELTDADEAEVDALIFDATDGDDTLTKIDYTAFVTKLLSL